MQDQDLAVGPTRFILRTVCKDIKGEPYALTELERAMICDIYGDQVPHGRMGAGEAGPLESPCGKLAGHVKMLYEEDEDDI